MLEQKKFKLKHSFSSSFLIRSGYINCTNTIYLFAYGLLTQFNIQKI